MDELLVADDICQVVTKYRNAEHWLPSEISSLLLSYAYIYTDLPNQLHFYS